MLVLKRNVNRKMLNFKCGNSCALFSSASLYLPLCKLLRDTISRIYHIEWISGMVLFIAGTRAIAGGAASSNQANCSRVQLTSKVASARSCTEKLISAKIVCSVF